MDEVKSAEPFSYWQKLRLGSYPDGAIFATERQA
jgi:hypothetical protein